jgi:hypothetical protein
MECNIDAKGRAYRLISGVIAAAAGVAVVALAWTGRIGGGWGWSIGLALLACGTFQIYEGWAGWCALRALGVRTPL